MLFGKKLREIRLSKHIGMRDIAEAIGLSPSDYIKLERGYIEPPRDPEWIKTVAEKLNIKEFSGEDMALYISWSKKFIMQEMPYYKPVMVLSNDGETPEEDMHELNLYLKEIVDNHNKKAKEFNGK